LETLSDTFAVEEELKGGVLSLPEKILSEIGSAISTIFYELFCTKVFCAAFHNLHFGLVIFWHKNTGTKAARKMWVKLATYVNFTHILQTDFCMKVFW